MKNNSLTYKKLALYMAIFFTIWSIRELIIRPVFLNQLDGVIFYVVESLIKIAVWTMPAVLFIRKFEKEMWLTFKKMTTNIPPWKMAFGYIGVMIAVPLINAIIHGEGIQLRADFDPIPLISAVLVVGITEEFVFRGFLLNNLLKNMKTEHAIAIDAILFTLIHYPIWIYHGFDLSTIMTSSIYVAVISVLFAHSFIKTKSIWIPIAMHMIHNLLLNLL